LAKGEKISAKHHWSGSCPGESVGYYCRARQKARYDRAHDPIDVDCSKKSQQKKRAVI
jgi:hypothetical protein